MDDNKPKTHTVAKFIDFIQFHSICQMLAKFSGVESERIVSKFRKRNRKFCVVFIYSIKRAREIRSFTWQSLVAQRRLRNVQKSVMHVQNFCFANLNLPCGTKFLREFIFADWRFFVICGN